MLYRAIYISDVAGTADTNAKYMAQILGVSDRNNRRDHITGLLIVHEGRFLQVIEGALADIERLLVRLAIDPRHRNMRLLTMAPTAERAFPQWSMAQAAPPLEALALLQVGVANPSAKGAMDIFAAAAARMPVDDQAD